MPVLDPKDRAALDRLVADVRAAHGEALLAVALTGEAASEAYRPRRSLLTTAVLLREVTFEALRRTREGLRAWRRRRVATPLLLDPHYVETALDVFPLEFLELRDRHILVYGEHDPFAGLRIHLPHLRLAVEEQLRGKLLHLWEAFLETRGSRRSLRALLLESPPGFELVMRGALELRRTDGEPAPGDLLAAVEGRFDLALPVLRRLEAARRSDGSLPGDELEQIFEGYLAEVHSLVGTIDAS